MRLDPQSPSALLSTYLWSWVAIGYGLTLLVGGDTRFSSTSYALVALLPGPDHVSFGLPFVVLGIGTLAAQRASTFRTRQVFLGLLIVLAWISAGLVAGAALVNPHASPAGAAIFTGIALQNMILWRLWNPPPLEAIR